MIDTDLKDLQHTSSLFMLETQSLSSQLESCTGIPQEDALIEEALSITEIVLMASMLMSLVKFDVVGSAQSEGDLNRCLTVCR
jgi:hypothetical protein